MSKVLSNLIERLDHPSIATSNVIRWGSPVPSFGDVSRSSVATLGLNPINREFVDVYGKELDGPSRRFHTLGSLGLKRWKDVGATHLRMIMESCRSYFSGNPYDGWFRKLDRLISGTSVSYYGLSSGACHLDLIPYATGCKWTELSTSQRKTLMALSEDTLGILLRDSPVRLLILNGKSVVNHFQEAYQVELERIPMREWALPRKSEGSVMGYGYKGVVRDLSTVRLGREVLVVGFNHNIQSSFGVTTDVTTAIRHWIADIAAEVL
jgi:hypothetical protein